MKKLLLLCAGILITSSAFAGWATTGKDASGATITVDVLNAKVSDGFVYSVSSSAVALADGATMYYYIHMASDTVKPDEIYVSMNAQASATCRIDIYENPVFTSTSTAITPINLNRESTKTSSVLITSFGPISGGTLLWQEMIPVAGLTNRVDMLLPDTKNYAFVVTNVSGGAAKVSLAIIFREVYK